MTPETATASRPKSGMPVQKRSRERYELILGVAEQMLLEVGGDAFKMSDLVARSGVPFGSLYQYFPDKAAVIGALSNRYNQIGRDCVSVIFAPVADPDGLLAALDGSVDGFYQMFRDYPVMNAIWEATQADPELKRIDREDVACHAEMMFDAVSRAMPDKPDGEARILSHLATELMACAVRHAITLDEAEAKESLEVFKRGLKGFFVSAP